jgi:hypothetical protein
MPHSIVECGIKFQNPNFETAAFAPQGGASRRQAKQIPNRNIKIQNDFV